MRITGQETTSAPRPENAVRSNAVSRTDSAEGVENSSEVASSDRVELSSQVRDIQRAQELAQNAPEVRTDRVEEARRALQNGTLNLDGRDLAERVLQENLPN